jgi:hypothetical protein
MEIIKLSIQINSDKQKVWNALLEDSNYCEWTTEFHPGSHYIGNWEKGSEIKFVAQNNEGNLEGMFSRIKENIEFEFISIEHLGFIKNGIVDTESEEVKKWTPSFENYTLTENDSITELTVEMQIAEEYKSMFEEIWPRALSVIKNISER